MSSALEQLLAQVGEQQAAGFILVLARISPLFLIAPLFSSKMIPARARSVCAVGLAVGMTPIVRGREQLPLDLLGLGGLVAKEMLIGLAFAFTIAALFAAVQVAGHFLDVAMGFSFGSVVDPITGVNSSLIAQLYALIGVAVFIAIGGEGFVIQGLARTYELVPLDAWPALAPLVAGVDEAFVAIFRSALEVCAPVLLAVVLTDTALGLLSRVVPQLNVFAVAFPAKILVGFIVLGASLPFAADWLGQELENSVGAALQALRVG